MKSKKDVSKTEALIEATMQTFGNADGRVIVRRRDVLMFELVATEEHLNGLRASLAEVEAHRARLTGKIAGLTRVLAKRV